MKRLSPALFALAISAISANAHAEIIASKMSGTDGPRTSVVRLSDETAKLCEQNHPGSKLATMYIYRSKKADLLYHYLGCYAMREPGVLSISFLDKQSGQWLSYTSSASSFQKTEHFKEWPGDKFESSAETERMVDEMLDAMMEVEKEKARGAVE